MENKPRIRIADSIFAHGTSLGSGDLKIYPKYFDWYRGTENINDVIVITESHFHLVDTYSEKIKIAWLIEPPSINSQSYQFIMENEHKFNVVLTHQTDLIRRKSFRVGNFPLYQFYFFGGCWIEEPDRGLYTLSKSKNVSIIASNKTLTEGHKLRHELINKYRDKIDGIYGNGYQFVQNKLEALKEYRYSIVIENEQSPIWVTEKLIDVMQCGCIPIYWGPDPLTLKYDCGFDTNGILSFHSAEALELILKRIDGTHYFDHAEAVVHNFEVSKKFVCPEDFLWDSFFGGIPEIRRG